MRVQGTFRVRDCRQYWSGSIICMAVYRTNLLWFDIGLSTNSSHFHVAMVEATPWLSGTRPQHSNRWPLNGQQQQQRWSIWQKKRPGMIGWDCCSIHFFKKMKSIKNFHFRSQLTTLSPFTSIENRSKEEEEEREKTSWADGCEGVNVHQICNSSSSGDGGGGGHNLSHNK